MAEIEDLPTPDLPFEEIYAAVQGGDVAAQELAVRRVLPLVIVAIQRRFRGQSAIDADDAALSAFRTILRRGWDFRREEQRIEPGSWDQLAALCVRFAYNKARTTLRKQRRRKEANEADLPSNAVQDAVAQNVAVRGAVQGHASGDEPPDVQAIRREMLGQVRTVLDQISESLDPRELEILRGKLDGEPSRQIQERLAGQDVFLTESGIDKRWRRKVIPKLRELLGDGHGD